MNLFNRQPASPSTEERLLDLNEISAEIQGIADLRGNYAPESNIGFQHEVISPAANESMGVKDITRDTKLANLLPFDIYRASQNYVVLKNAEEIIKQAHLAYYRQTNQDYQLPDDFELTNPAILYFRSIYAHRLNISCAKFGRERELLVTQKYQLDRGQKPKGKGFF